MTLDTHERDDDMAQDKTERVTDDELAAASALTVGDAVFHRVQEGYQDGWPRAVFHDADGEPSGVRCTPDEATAIAEGAAALLLLPKMARELTALRANEANTKRLGEEWSAMLLAGPMHCGHTVGDLIGGTETAPDGTERPCVTKCGACLALRQPEIVARRKADEAHTALFLRYQNALQAIISGGQPYDPEGIAREALFGGDQP